MRKVIAVLFALVLSACISVDVTAPQEKQVEETITLAPFAPNVVVVEGVGGFVVTEMRFFTDPQTLVDLEKFEFTVEGASAVMVSRSVVRIDAFEDPKSSWAFTVVLQAQQYGATNVTVKYGTQQSRFAVYVVQSGGKG